MARRGKTKYKSGANQERMMRASAQGQRTITQAQARRSSDIGEQNQRGHQMAMQGMQQMGATEAEGKKAAERKTVRKDAKDERQKDRRIAGEKYELERGDRLRQEKKQGEQAEKEGALAERAQSTREFSAEASATAAGVDYKQGPGGARAEQVQQGMGQGTAQGQEQQPGQGNEPMSPEQQRAAGVAQQGIEVQEGGKFGMAQSPETKAVNRMKAEAAQENAKVRRMEAENRQMELAAARASGDKATEKRMVENAQKRVDASEDIYDAAHNGTLKLGDRAEIGKEIRTHPDQSLRDAWAEWQKQGQGSKLDPKPAPPRIQQFLKHQMGMQGLEYVMETGLNPTIDGTNPVMLAYEAQGEAALGEMQRLQEQGELSHITNLQQKKQAYNKLRARLTRQAMEAKKREMSRQRTDALLSIRRPQPQQGMAPPTQNTGPRQAAPQQQTRQRTYSAGVK